MDEFPERAVRFLELVHQHLAHRFVAFFELDVPLCELAVDVDPIVPRAAFMQPRGNRVELLKVTLRRFLRLDALPVENALDGEQHLVRMHRLDEVIRDFRADGVFHDRLFLAFRDHDHGQTRIQVFDAAQGRDAVHAGHLLVEKDQVEGLGRKQSEGIHPVGDGRHGEAFPFQEKDMRTQLVDFVVSPEDVGHEGFRLSVVGCRWKF